jgi:hypothetical protein
VEVAGAALIFFFSLPHLLLISRFLLPLFAYYSLEIRVMCKRSRYLGADSGELAQVPPWDLHYAVVEAGLKAGSCGSRHRVPDIGQGNSEGQFGSHVRQRVACSLAGQGRAPRQTCIHLQPFGEAHTLPSIDRNALLSD